MIYGLLSYSTGSDPGSHLLESFEILLLARIISAFGIAVGSVVTQTILRDLYDKEQIGKAFSFVGIGLSISPVIGMLTGSAISSKFRIYGHFWVTIYSGNYTYPSLTQQEPCRDC